MNEELLALYNAEVSRLLRQGLLCVHGKRERWRHYDAWSA